MGKDNQDKRQPSSQLSQADFYRLMNNKIDHQDDLINQRVVWLVVSEAFFFIAFVTLISAPKQAQDNYPSEHHLLYCLIPISGLLAGVFTYVAILGSMTHIGQLHRLITHYFRQTPKEDSSASGFPPIQGSEMLRHVAKVAPICLPLVFILTWVVILAVVAAKQVLGQ